MKYQYDSILDFGLGALTFIANLIAGFCLAAVLCVIGWAMWANWVEILGWLRRTP